MIKGRGAKMGDSVLQDGQTLLINLEHAEAMGFVIQVFLFMSQTVLSHEFAV